MIRVLIMAGGVFMVILAVYLIIAITQTVKRSAWPGDSPQYRNHLAMARWIERHLRDDMVAVTIPPAEKDEAARLLEQFYGERQVGRSD